MMERCLTSDGASHERWSAVSRAVERLRSDGAPREYAPLAPDLPQPLRVPGPLPTPPRRPPPLRPRRGEVPSTEPSAPGAGPGGAA